MKIFFYNPENDLALCNGDQNYVAPKSAISLARDLSEVIFPMMDHSDFIWDEISGQFKTLFDCQCFRSEERRVGKEC